MTREDFSFRSNRDGLEVACYRWPASATAVGVLQIAHGMGEHALRYAHVAEFFSKAGFHTYANDHRGHGRTAGSKESLGDFGAGGWDALVDDVATLTNLVRAREAGLPVILLGHSMGSFALQQYLLDRSALIDGAVISGSAAIDLMRLGGERRTDLQAFNEPFEPARTPFDWLSRDPAVVDAYIADPLCGFNANERSSAGMMAAAARVAGPAALARIRKDLPIYILAGDADPINHRLEWLKPLAERYRAAGIAEVTEKYYRDGRHEMLNETNRAEVLADLLAWMRRVVGR
jgi:alpha-beta hydrolase superfamily lysophospholipase